MRSTRLGRLLAPLLLLPALTACSGGEEAKPSPRETAPDGVVFNGADAAFARELLLQRAEEFVLIDLTLERDLSPALTTFVDEARVVRAAEVDQATTWLTDWGKEVPTTIRDHSSGHAGEAHHFPDVEEASDATFEAAWIEAFLAELEESDAIASAEQQHGLYAEATALAEAVDAVNDDESDLLEELAG